MRGRRSPSPSAPPVLQPSVVGDSWYAQEGPDGERCDSPGVLTLARAQIDPAMTTDPKATQTTQRIGISTETNSNRLSETSLSYAAESQMVGIDNSACNFGAQAWS